MPTDTAQHGNAAHAVFVAIPTLNEAKHIATVVSALRHSNTQVPLHICVLDGGSTDGTPDIVRGIAGVELVHNPRRTQATALNLAAELARARGGFRYLLRVDAHASYPANFISVLVSTMETSEAASVVVPMETQGGNVVQDAASILFNSWLGNGGAAHRSGRSRGYVDHGHHALFRLDAFLAVGGYDARFLANEDAELDLRLTQAGFKIFMENATVVGYHPRDTYAGTWKQMKRNGFYRFHTLVKHSRMPSTRQLIPMSLAPGLAGALILSLIAFPVLIAIPVAYIAAVSTLAWKATKAASPNGSLATALRVAWLAMVSHLAFSLGASQALLQLFVLNPDRRADIRTVPSNTTADASGQ